MKIQMMLFSENRLFLSSLMTFRREMDDAWFIIFWCLDKFFHT